MKKSQQIGTMVTPEVKAALQKYADEHRWTLSSTVSMILEAWYENEKKTSKE